LPAVVDDYDEVEAHAYDNAGNVMKKTAGGGLTYLLGKLVAGFLSFLLGPALAGAVFGFFLGFMAGLFDDLSIFLQIGDMFNAISQFPQMIGNLISNPGLIVSMIVDMVGAHLMRCNIVNPYLTQDNYGKDASWWNQRVVKKFWGESDPEADGMGNAIVFSVACTVSSVTGWLAQSSIVKSGTMKFVRHTMEDAARPGSSLLVLRVVPRWPAAGHRFCGALVSPAPDDLVLIIRRTATIIPAKRIATSTAVPAPTSGGIDSCPVRRDNIPVAASASTKGIDASMNAFATAILSFPPFHGLLLDDQTPATSMMIANARSAIDLG